MRNTPKRVSLGAALRAADSARASTMRVSSRVDDAVVPEPRRRVIGTALLLILRADRRLELFFLLGAPGFTPCRDGIAADLARTLAACSPPITEMRAFGHIQRKRGS